MTIYEFNLHNFCIFVSDLVERGGMKIDLEKSKFISKEKEESRGN